MKTRRQVSPRRIALRPRDEQSDVETPFASDHAARIASDETGFRPIGDKGSRHGDGIDPQYLRSRARRYRELADQETDAERAELFRKLAAAFDRDADSRGH